MRRCRRPNAREHAVLAERVREAPEAGDRRRHRRDEDQHAGDADVDAERHRRASRGSCPIASTMPISGARIHSSPSSVAPISGNAERPTSAIATDRHDDDDDRREELRGSARPGCASPRRGWRPSRVRCRRASRAERERELVPGRARCRGRCPGSTPPARRRARSRARRAGAASRGRAGDDERDTSRARRRTRRTAAIAAITPTPTTTSHGSSRRPRPRRSRRRGSAARRAPPARSRSGSRGRAPSRS